MEFKHMCSSSIISQLFIFRWPFTCCSRFCFVMLSSRASVDQDLAKTEVSKFQFSAFNLHLCFNDYLSHFRNKDQKKKQHICHIPGCNKVYGKTSHLRAHLRYITHAHINPGFLVAHRATFKPYWFKFIFFASILRNLTTRGVKIVQLHPISQLNLIYAKWQW